MIKRLPSQWTVKESLPDVLELALIAFVATRWRAPKFADRTPTAASALITATAATAKAESASATA